MGRHGKSDEVKRLLGKQVRASETEEARLLRRAENVLMFPRLREIPPSSLPLQERGTKVYNDWSRRLFDAGMLTEILLKSVEQLALTEDAIYALAQAGKPISAKFLEIRRGALARLEGLNVDSSLIPGMDRPNRFAFSGFPAKRRAAANRGVR